MAKTAFTKGQEVTFISNWDSKGTYYFQHAVVYSCGTKQMILTDAETGTEMGRNFVPTLEEKYEGQTFPRLTDEEATTVCLTKGAAKVVAEKARMEHAIEATNKMYPNSHGYEAAVRKDIAALHEPRAVKHTNARHNV